MVLVLSQLCPPALSAAELLEAARNNDPARVARLVASGADVNERDRQRATPLHWMAFHGNESAVKALIGAGARVDATLANGSTPLHLAAYKGHAAVVRVLLASGADADARNRDGITPTDWARRNRHPAIVALLDGDGGQTAGPVPAAAPPSPRPEVENTTPQPKASTQGPGGYRVQLVAVSSETRAEKAADTYQGRFADLLQGQTLLIEAVEGPTRPMYRVQSGPIPSARARAICEELKRREQACLIRAATGD